MHRGSPVQFPLHVLVVDEDSAVLERVSRALTDAGYRVTTRANTLGARADILALRPDIVVLDPRASRLRGDDLTLLLGLHPETADTAVVFHCSEGKGDVRRKGAFGVVRKTNDMNAFVAQFEKLAEQYVVSGLPREDRAVIAERHFSGTHRIASKAEPEPEVELLQKRGR